MDRSNAYDIGIYTFWNVPNYGTFAQAYAMQKIISSLQPKSDVRQIAYLPQLHYDFYYSIIPKTSKRSASFYKELFKRIKPHSSFNKKKELFLNNYATIPHTKNFHTKENLKETFFNTVIIGSDIVWDFSFDIFDHDHFLFGNDFKTNMVCAFSASFGTVKFGTSLPDYVQEGIQKMHHISVRDENSANIVEQITGNRPQVTLDPTWLWDFSNDDSVIQPQEKNYLVVYGQDFNSSFINQIITYAQDKGMQIICLDCNNDNYNWCDKIIRQHELSPYQWLGYFKNATAVATSTFHGLTFSLVFNKPLAFCATPFILSKADAFLKKVGLYDLYVNDSPDARKMFDFRWDFESINQVICEEKEKSIDALKTFFT